MSKILIKTKKEADYVGAPEPWKYTGLSGKQLAKAVLEFDFVPQFDTVRFRYVFGSEEFFEYCNSYNDAFGFFLSGPGITGTFSNNSVNIALMPGSSSLYVTINNICANTMSRWDNSGGQFYQYDGLTHVFTAWHIVQPCSTYHIKLAIADAVDFAFDSGVFLEQNSFSSPGVEMNTSTNVPALGKKALEGCNDVAVNFRLSTILNYPYPVHYTIGGTAVNGVDYTQIPNTVIFPPGSDSVAVVIHPLWDTLVEGEKTVILTVNQISCTGQLTKDTVFIEDYSRMRLLPNRDTTLCHGGSVELIASRTGGMEPFIYQWNISPSTDTIVSFVPPVGINPCVVHVTDVCNNLVADTAIITVHPVPIADAGQNVTIPNGTSTTLHGLASGGYGNYSYLWTSNPPGFNSIQQNPTTGNLTFTTIYYLVVTDLQSGCQSETAQVMVIVAGGPLTANPAVDPQEICVGSSANLYALAGGGSGIYSYSWNSDPPGFASTQSTPVITPPVTTKYYVTVNDGFNQFTANTQVVVDPLPVINLGPADTSICIYDTVILDAGNPGSTYAWSNRAHTRTITTAATGIGYELQTYQVKVTNPNSCIDSATINVIFSYSACTGIHRLNNENGMVIIPNPNHGIFKVADRTGNPILRVECFNMPGEKVFEKSWNQYGDEKADRAIDVQYLSKGFYFVRITGNLSASSQIIVIN
ncbi:MAG: choice-of-anchor L domain-containing protein [Bacteroidota bacterium]